MAKISILNCIVLFTILWLFCEVVECRQVRRHDVHRIILKGKSRNRNKKPSRPPSHSHEYHHEASRDPFENFYDPYHDQVSEYSNQHVRYHNRHRDQVRDYDRPKESDRYYKYKDFEHRQHPEGSDLHGDRHNYHVLDIGEFNKNQDGYRNNFPDAHKYRDDFERYKKLMDYYNKRNENMFRKKLENSKQKIVPYVEESISTGETHNYPIIWKTPNIEGFKGDWSPMSRLEFPEEAKFSTTNPHKNIEMIELTTSKPLILPSIIVESNLTNALTRHRTTNFNFGSGSENTHHPNHKYPMNTRDRTRAKNRYKGNKKGSYQVHEENGDVTISPILGNFQNLAPAADISTKVSFRRPVAEDLLAMPNQTVFGARTKLRKTKRPHSISK